MLAALYAFVAFAISATSATSAETFSADQARSFLQSNAHAEDLNEDRAQFLSRLQQFVMSVGTEDARLSSSGLSGHCLWPPIEAEHYNGSANPLGVHEMNATLKEKKCLPRCKLEFTWSTVEMVDRPAPLSRVTAVKYVVVPYTTVAVGTWPMTACYELHRLDLCLFALRVAHDPTVAFLGARHLTAMKKWLLDAGWVVDGSRGDGTGTLPFALKATWAWSFVFGC